MTLPHLLLALGVVIVWGLNFVFMAIGLRELPPILFTLLRYLLAAVPLVFFVRRPAVPARLLAGYGLLQFAMQFTLLFGALEIGMPAGLASLVIQIQVFFTMLLAMPLHGERPHPLQWLGAGVAFAGVGAIGSHLPGEVPIAGLVLVLGAAASWASGNLITKRLGAQADAKALVAWGSLIALPALALASLLLEGPALILSSLEKAGWATLAAVLFNAWPATLFGFGAWSLLMRRYPAATVTPFALLVPITGMGGAALFLDERFGAWTALAAALVLTGLALNLAGARRKLSAA